MSAKIIIRCADCRRFAPKDKDRCECGRTIKNLKLRDYYLDLTGRENPRPGTARTRKRIGLSVNAIAAENELRKLVTAVTEGKFIDRDQAGVMTLDKLKEWHLKRPEVKGLRSYDVLKIQFENIVSRVGPTTTVAQLTEDTISSYRAKREAEDIKPSTVNKETAQLMAALNAAVRAKKLHANPLAGIGKLDEDNARDFTLELAEIEALLRICAKVPGEGPAWLAPLVEVAFFTLMREGELLKLTWDRVALDDDYVKLRGVDTKSKDGRLVTLHPRAKAALAAIKPKWAKGPVFVRANGEPVTKEALRYWFREAVETAKLQHDEYGWFRFHDLRHCGAEHYQSLGSQDRAILSLGGWKTPSMLKRYTAKSQAKLQEGLVFGTGRRKG